MIEQKKIILIIILLIAGLISLSAQEKTRIEGSIKDDKNKPVPYVNVFLLNTTDGTMSDEEGNFSFKTSAKGKVVLIASIVGYEKFEREFEITATRFHFDIQLKEKAVNLKETIVTGSSYGSEKEKGLVISRIDVLTTPGGAADIFQSLKTLPGLTQVSESAELYVRGGDPIETLTMVDGSIVYHPFTFESAYGGLFSNLTQSAVKGIYFSSGGFSSKYGNVLSGVLDIETRDQPSRSQYQIGLSLANGSLTADIPLSENKLGMYFDLRQSFTKPIFWLNGGLDRMTLSPTSRNGTGGIIYSYSKTGKLKLFGMIADDKQGVKVERAEYTGAFNGNSNNLFVNLQNTNILFESVIMKNSVAYNKYSNNWLIGILDLTKTDYVYTFRNDFEISVNSSNKILVGAEYEKREVNYLGKIPEDDFDIRPDGNSKIIDATFYGSRFAGYTEFQSANPFGLSNVSVATGIRYDRIPELKLDWLDPRLSISYKLSDKSIVKLGAGVFHQLPNPQLFRPVDGNPNLKSMKAEHLIISYDYNIDEQNSFRMEVYHKEYSNLPKENSILNYDNSGKGFANGVDIIFKGFLPFNITGWISYGFINTKRDWMDFDGFTSSSFDITHNFSLVLKYNLSDLWQIGINAKYATGRPYTPVESSYYRDDLKIFEPIYAATNSDRFPDYRRIDLRIMHFNTIFENISFVAYMEGLNIFNHQNIFGYTYSPDYSERKEIKSYFGRRMLVFGFMFGF
ncbi:MAG: TonB-dependent receptor [Melioribacter sp.]|nr:TonB-dependent receptor [Melioribacter sp.]